MRSFYWYFVLFTLYLGSNSQDINSNSNLEEVHAFVSKIDPVKEIGWYCDCYNSTDGNFALVPECRCHGKEFKEVPIDLGENLHRITITDSELTFIERDSFQPYRFTLEEVILGNLQNLQVIEVGTFRGLLKIRTLYVSNAPKLQHMNGLFEGFISKRFLSLRIVQTSLVEIPDLSNLHIDDHVMHMIELDRNKFRKLKANSIRINAEQVTLNYNEIEEIEDFAFNTSQIGAFIANRELSIMENGNQFEHLLQSLRGNYKLNILGENSFYGLKSLYQLDLSETSLQKIPIIGLGELEVLKVENAATLKVIPSVYDFPNLQEAYLTHSFHCCAFKYPKQHDPDRYAKHQRKIQRICKENSNIMDTGQIGKVRKKRETSEDSWGESADYNSLGYEIKPGRPNAPNDWTPNLEHLKGHPNKKDHSHLNPIRGILIETEKSKNLPEQTILGIFHESSAEIIEDNNIITLCGNISTRINTIRCTPESNALNPCEDIMGSYYLRISVWFVLILAVLGNLAVITVVIFSGAEVSVSRFLMCNLSFADLCMGLYLLLIASMDLHSVGAFFNFAFDWQYGPGCYVAGFLTVFASQLSIFTLTVITLERWVAIAYAIYLTRRIRIGLAAKVMVMGWLYSIFMASLPLVGVSSYSSTSICLPMEVNKSGDLAYLIMMVLLNGAAFCIIVFCYAQIYFSLARETREMANPGELTIAKKMALLVFTDFACWAPIAFFALTALAGYPLIGVTKSKILLVFFYPLNSCANPYLYAIMTAQYRKDLCVMLSKLGMCTESARKYSMTTSLPTNITHPTPLLGRNGRKQSAIEDAFV